LPPTVIANPDKLLDKSNMIWAAWFANKLQTDLFGGVMSFSIVTFQASAYQVFPCIRSAVNLGNNMINCHLSLALAAVLASASVSLDDILASQHDPFDGDLDIKFQSDHRWNRDPGRSGTKNMAIRCFDNLGLAEIKHYHGTPYTTNGNRLKIVV
jgi:hypothetical protein